MTKRLKRKYTWNRIRFYLGILLLLFYLVIGCLFLFSDTWSDMLPRSRYIIGIVLILFGLLRFYVSYRRFVNKKLRINLQHENDDKKTTDS
jgi:cytochrome c biogenesis protein CcdA